MNDYFFKKLSIINYKMAIHEGNANRRLASQSVEILHKLFLSEVPGKFKKEFNELINLIDKTLSKIQQPGVYPVKIDGIKNKKAANYIKMLIEIEDFLK